MFQQLVFLAPKNLIWDLMPKENTDLYSEMEKENGSGGWFWVGTCCKAASCAAACCCCNIIGSIPGGAAAGGCTIPLFRNFIK